MADAYLTVICYDIVSSDKRRRIASVLEREAVRVQQSVFEGWFTPDDADLLVDRLAPQLGERDSLRLYMITTTGLRHGRTVGATPPSTGRSYYLVGDD